MIYADVILQISRLIDCNWTRTQNHLVRKRTLNHLAKLTISRLCNLQSRVSQTVILATNYEENIASLWNDVG